MLGLVFPDAYNGLTLVDSKAAIADEKLAEMQGKDVSCAALSVYL